jgi:methylase of polypeptide subunit release factors
MALSPPPPAPPADVPLRIASAEAFARVRQFCRDADFDDATVCRALAVKELHQADELDWANVDLDTVADGLRWCIDVLFRGLPAPESQSRAICGDAAFAAFFELGLLEVARHRPDMVISPVWIYPVDDFLIVSDRRDNAAGATAIAGDDVIFPAIDVGTLRFLHFMPDARGGEALDLCGGCGVGALHAARTARYAATVDVTSRSTAFAEFNAHLNGMPIASLCGDLYAPVHNRRFDLITAHPPYVPTYGRAYVFRDGGDSGEIIVRRVIEGLPTHLRTDGVAMLVCAGRDTADEMFEQRVTSWLGPDATDFDIVFGLIKNLTIEDVVASLQSRSQPLTAEEARELRARLAELKTRQFAYGVLMLRRYGDPINETPLRIRLTETTVPADLDRLLHWRAFRRQAGFKPWLSAARPRFTSNTELAARHVVQDNRLIPSELTFHADGAFQSALRLDAWMVSIVANCDGERSTIDIFNAARSRDEMPEAFTFEDFANLVALMVEHGILEVEHDARQRRAGMN